MAAIEADAGLVIAEIKDINRRMSIGEAGRRAKKNGRGQPALVI